MPPWDPACRPVRLVRPVRVDPAGICGPTRNQAAGPRWRRTTPGFYVPTETATNLPEQRILEQAMRLPAGGVVTGWAGCRLFGANFFDGLGRDGHTRLPVPLALGPRGRERRHQDVRLLYERLLPGELTQRQGVPTTTILRSTFDAIRLADDEREAVVVIDMVAAARLLSIERLAAVTGTHSGWTNIEQARRAVLRASEHSRSPNETRLRLVWELDARLPAPLVNCPVRDRDSGRLLGIADLLDETAGLVIEFDGADHRGAHRHTKDVDREELLRRHQLEVCRVTGLALRDQARVAVRLRAAHARAGFQRPEERTWYAVPRAESLEQELLESEALVAAREEQLAARLVLDA
jgi:hypothetical protein